MTRREFGMVASAILLGAGSRAPPRRPHRAVSLVLAPSNLGLRPENGQQPGTWQAPRVLMEAGLRDALEAHEVLCLERPLYEFEAQPRTRIRNGRTIRAFSFALAEKVQGILEAGRFPVVIGGDCSVLLGSLYGARLAGGRGLVHVDGHSDFTQEKSYATPQTLGAAAGMDLALASGRGEPLLTDWPDLEGPLAADADIDPDRRARRPRAVVPGVLRRHCRPRSPASTRRTCSRKASRRASDARSNGSKPAASTAPGCTWTSTCWTRRSCPPSIPLAVPASTTRSSPTSSAASRASGRIVGADFAIYDPERDPEHGHARDLVACIADGIGRRSTLRGQA